MVAIARSLDARLLRERNKERMARQARQQAAAFRAWMNLGDRPLNDFLALAPQVPTPGQLNPLGRLYERERAADPSLRPIDAPRLIARQPAPVPPVRPEPLPMPPAQPPFSPPAVPPIRDPNEELRTGLAIAQLAQLEGAQTAPGNTLVDIAQRFPDVLRPEVAAGISNQMLSQGQVPPGLGPQFFPAGEITAFNMFQREREALRPLTDPAGRFLGGAALEGLPAAAARRVGVPLPEPRILPLDVARGLGAPVPEIRPREIAEDIGGAVGPEVLVPSTAVPIPVFDPLVAKGVGLAGRGIGAAARPLLRRGAAEVLEEAAPVVAREAAERVPRAAGEVAEAAPSLARQVGGGAPLTREAVTGRTPPAVGAEPPAFVQGMKDALTRGGPGRSAREAGRIANGVINLGNQEVKVWGEDMADLAGRAGIRIVKGAGIEKQSDELVGVVERVWGAVDPATSRTARGQLGSFPEQQRPFVEALYDRVDNLTQKIVAADPEFAKHALDEYFPHLFKTAKRPGVATGRGGLGTRPGFGRRRELEGGLGEILNDRPDLDLVTWDPIDLLKRHEVAVNNHLAQLEAIRLLKADDAMRLKADAPSFWRTPDLRGWGMRERLQHWRAPPQVATGLENLFGKSAFDSNGLLKAVKGARGILFRIKVAGGLFQHIDFSQRAILRGVAEGLREMSPIRRTGKGVSIGGGFKAAVPGLPKNMVRSMFSPFRATARSAIPALDRKISRLTLANPHLRGGYRNGLGAGADPSIGEGAIRGLGGVVPQTVGGKAIPGTKWLQDTVEFMTGGAYETFHKEMLEQGYLVTLQKHLREGVPLEEAYRLAAEETNVVFSSVPAWQSAVMNQTTKDIIRIGVFSPGEFEGLVRMPFQSPASFAGIIGGTVVAAQMLNKLFTGEFLKPEQMLPYKLDPDEIKRLQEDPRSILSAGVPGVDYRTTFLRPELPWTGPGGRKLYLDLLGQADTVFRVALDPIFALQTRLGQLPRAALDLEQIRRGEAPAFGERVESPADLARAAAQQVSPIAVTGFAGTERGRIGVTGAGIQSSGVNISAEPLRELLARRFEEIRGIPFNPEIHYPVARQDPELQPILEDLDRAGIQFGAEGATEAAEREAFLAEREQELGLPRKAASVLRGHVAGIAGFNEAYSDFQSTAAAAAARDFFGTEPREARTPEGRDYQAYRDIRPNDQRFENPETLEIDWGLYMTEKDEAFARLPGDLQRAIENRTAVQDEDVNRLARQIKAWRGQLDPYYAEEQGAARLRFRQRTPDVDAILWILGSVSKVAGGRGRSAAVTLLGDDLGIRIAPRDVPIRTQGGRPGGGRLPAPVGSGGSTLPPPIGGR